MFVMNLLSFGLFWECIYVDLLIDKYKYCVIVWWLECDPGWLDQDGSHNDIK